jgi:hypothetical protein
MDTNRLQQVFTSNASLHSAEVAFLHQELARLDQVIASATSKRDEYKALLAPLRRNIIPPEVLGEIFSHVAHAYTDSEPTVH